MTFLQTRVEPNMQFQVIFGKKKTEKSNIDRYLRVVLESLEFGKVSSIVISTRTRFRNGCEEVLYIANVYLESWYDTRQNSYRQDQLLKHEFLFEFYNCETYILILLPDIQYKELTKKYSKSTTHPVIKKEKQEKMEREREVDDDYAWFNGEVQYTENSLYE